MGSWWPEKPDAAKNGAVLVEVRRLAANERRATAQLVAAARRARRTSSPPLILELLARGDIRVTGVGLLAKILTSTNHRELLTRATHKSKREIEEIIAAVRPQPDVASSVRKLPALQMKPGSNEPVLPIESATRSSSPLVATRT